MFLTIWGWWGHHLNLIIIPPWYVPSRVDSPVHQNQTSERRKQGQVTVNADCKCVGNTYLMWGGSRKLTWVHTSKSKEHFLEHCSFCWHCPCRARSSSCSLKSHWSHPSLDIELETGHQKFDEEIHDEAREVSEDFKDEAEFHSQWVPCPGPCPPEWEGFLPLEGGTIRAFIMPELQPTSL